MIQKTALITGVTGQDGSYHYKHLLKALSSRISCSPKEAGFNSDNPTACTQIGHFSNPSAG